MVMEYGKAREGWGDTESVREVQGVLEWDSEGREGTESVREGQGLLEKTRED